MDGLSDTVFKFDETVKAEPVATAAARKVRSGAKPVRMARPFWASRFVSAEER